MIIPSYLKKGDTIGIVAPAGFMPVEKMQTCIETLDAWGYNVEMGTTTHSNSTNYFSGTDEERLQDLQQMLDNKKIDAILCARGGYGTSRIIDDLDFKKFRKHPKWIIGFSDVTVLHSHLYTNYKIASLHAPMAAAFNEGEANNPFVQSLRQALEGEPATYETASHEFNKAGLVEAELIGGNLSLLAHLIGTDSDLKTKHRILFLEDVGEYLYNIDRMLVQLKRAGKFDKLAGLIIGGFTDSKDTERPFGKNVHEIIYDHVKEFDYPVCFDFPVSHAKENYALKIGVNYSLETGSDKTVLKEVSEP
ncbi:S66 peptidase family protein [Flavisolibacter ginsenosidimutans]|uniref:LD-carboxypeptidase n=1 Tax=Flavisolibacter ginsenosidimutans TaxID=661481 RepID=A0A5B8UGB2_9BACT|nr:LD-carboxypeptidase [Flavisolibacter ginsenosidimutans]QEC55179.1 LD-carboxypeptidase [Flavisolibacter ginsenosidimutans]